MTTSASSISAPSTRWPSYPPAYPKETIHDRVERIFRDALPSVEGRPLNPFFQIEGQTVPTHPYLTRIGSDKEDALRQAHKTGSLGSSWNLIYKTYFARLLQAGPDGINASLASLKQETENSRLKHNPDFYRLFINMVGRHDMNAAYAGFMKAAELQVTNANTCAEFFQVVDEKEMPPSSVMTILSQLRSHPNLGNELHTYTTFISTFGRKNPDLAMVAFQMALRNDTFARNPDLYRTVLEITSYHPSHLLTKLVWQELRNNNPYPL